MSTFFFRKNLFLRNFFPFSCNIEYSDWNIFLRPSERLTPLSIMSLPKRLGTIVLWCLRAWPLIVRGASCSDNCTPFLVEIPNAFLISTHCSVLLKYICIHIIYSKCINFIRFQRFSTEHLQWNNHENPLHLLPQCIYSIGNNLNYSWWYALIKNIPR